MTLVELANDLPDFCPDCLWPINRDLRRQTQAVPLAWRHVDP
jgi:hypothetical protein